MCQSPRRWCLLQPSWSAMPSHWPPKEQCNAWPLAPGPGVNAATITQFGGPHVAENRPRWWTAGLRGRYHLLDWTRPRLCAPCCQPCEEKMQRFLRHLLPTGVLLLQVNAGTPIVWFGSWLCENSGGIARVEYLRRIAPHENLNTTAQAVGHSRAFHLLVTVCCGYPSPSSAAFPLRLRWRQGGPGGTLGLSTDASSEELLDVALLRLTPCAMV